MVRRRRGRLINAGRSTPEVLGRKLYIRACHRNAAKTRASISFGKPQSMLSSFHVLFKDPDRLGRARRALRARGGRKIWRLIESGLDLLQPFEIPQNRQRILWKSLAKNGLDLEILGKKLGASGSCAVGNRRSFAGLLEQHNSVRMRGSIRGSATADVNEGAKRRFASLTLRRNYAAPG